MRGGIITQEEMLAIPAYEISDMSQVPSEPLVSIMIITYNHEAFVEQTIQSVLEQQCDFPIELIIGEDKSTDRTLDICLDYQRRYPHLIRIVTWHENIGGQKNILRCWGRARGKYIALCEGDDYWIDPDKLSKQVEIMEQFPDTMLCGASVYFLDISNGDSLSGLLKPQQVKEPFEFEDVLREYLFHTSTFLFRNFDFKVPACATTICCMDYLLMAAAGIQGKIRYLPDIVSVYRIHPGGVYTALNDWGKYEKNIEFCRAIMQFTSKKQASMASKKRDTIAYLFCSKLASSGQFRDARIIANKTIWPLALHAPKMALLLIFKVCLPKTYRMVADVWIRHKQRFDFT